MNANTLLLAKDLNIARAMELKGISYYMRAHYVLEDMAYTALADAVKDIAIEEMKHAEYLSQRILELKSVPVMRPDYSDLELTKVPSSLYETMVSLEYDTVDVYETICTNLAQNGDHVSAQLLKKIIVQEEQHYQYFSDTFQHIVALGENFLAQMADRKFSPTEYSTFTTRGKM